MKEFKFECPSCGQRIGCDPAHAGRAIPCPGCRVEIRIPKSVAGAGVPKATVVQGRKSAEPKPGKPSPAEKKQLATPKATGKVTPARQTGKLRPAAQVPHAACPVCASELAVTVAGTSIPADGKVSFKVVKRGSAPKPAAAPAKTETKPKEPASKPKPKPEAPGIKTGRPSDGKKPNLAYILSGGAKLK
jgi:hypothetical protein